MNRTHTTVFKRKALFVINLFQFILDFAGIFFLILLSCLPELMPVTLIHCLYSRIVFGNDDE